MSAWGGRAIAPLVACCVRRELGTVSRRLMRLIGSRLITCRPMLSLNVGQGQKTIIAAVWIAGCVELALKVLRQICAVQSENFQASNLAQCPSSEDVEGDVFGYLQLAPRAVDRHFEAVGASIDDAPA